MTENTEDKRGVCRLAGEFLLWFLLAAIILPLLLGVTSLIMNIVTVVDIVLLALLAMTFLLSVTRLISIGLKKKKPKGAKLARALAVISCLLFMGLYYFFMTPWMKLPCRLVCGTNLKGLGTAIAMSAADHNDMIPDGSNWCDLLITEVDMDPKLFRCEDSGVVYGESSYAINRNVAGKRHDQGSQVVILFETNLGRKNTKRTNKINERPSFNTYPLVSECFTGNEKVYLGRWNQIGGPEDLTVGNHKGEGCNILFGDGHVEFIKTEDIDKLRWGVE
jgi:prepilin-type processing-associated H-X9-DG protein